MELNKFKRLLLLLSAIFVISLIFTLADTYTLNSTAYDLGYSVGQMMRFLFNILTMLVLFSFLIRTVKVENLLLFVVSFFIISLIFTLPYLPSKSLSPFDLGFSVGQMMKHSIKGLFSILLLFAAYKKFNSEKLHSRI
jgi:hypothetical protein